MVYIRNLGSSYDPSTGEVTQNTEQFHNQSRGFQGPFEAGGVVRLQEAGIHHGTSGMPELPKPVMSSNMTPPGGRW